MTTMFFAGIPLEGTGIRPLDADLYGAEGQPVDHENISATGNLNVGVVIQYDEHASHSLQGSTLDRLSPSSGSSDTSRAIPAGLPLFEGSAPAAHGVEGDNSNLVQTTNLVNPSSQAVELPTGAERASNFSPATAADNAGTSPSAPSNNSYSTSSSESSASSYHDHASNGDTYNTYNYDNTVNNSTTNNNYTENMTTNYYDPHNGSGSITFGNITINEYLPGGNGGHGGDINNVLSLVNNTVVNTSTVVGDVVNIVNSSTSSITNDVTYTVNNILDTVNSSTSSTTNEVTSIVNNTVNNVTGVVNNVLSDTTTVLGDAGGIINGGTHTGGDIISQLLNTASTVINNGNDTVHSISTPIIGLEGSLTQTLSSLSNSILQNVGGVAGTALSEGGNLLGETINTVNHAGGPDLLTDLANGLQTVAGDAGGVTSPVNTIGHDLGGLPGMIAQAGNSIGDTIGGLNHGGGQDPLSGLVGGLQSVPHDLGGLNAPLSGIGQDLADLAPGAGSPTGPLGQILGDPGLPGSLPPIADASVSALAPSAPHASDALINVNGNLASGPQGSSANGGLVSVDASALSPGTNGFASGNGASVAVTPSNVSHDPVVSSLSPQISISLPPAPSSVPIVSDASHAVSTVGTAAHDTTGALDPSATLNALMQSHNVGVAVDGGVLFTGGGVSTGHESSSIPHAGDSAHMPALHSVLHGLHG